MLSDRKNRKFTELPQNDLEELTVKNTLHTVTTYPGFHILLCFALPVSTTTHFQDMAHFIIPH